MKLIFLAVFNLINSKTICNLGLNFHCDFAPWNLGFEFFEKDLMSTLFLSIPIKIPWRKTNPLRTSHVGYEFEYRKMEYKNFRRNVSFDLDSDGLTTHYELNLLIEHTCTKSKNKYIFYLKEISFSWFDEFYNNTVDLNLTNQGVEFVPWYKRILNVGEGNQIPP